MYSMLSEFLGSRVTYPNVLCSYVDWVQGSLGRSGADEEIPSIRRASSDEGTALLAGYFGFGNAGDEAILKVVLEGLARCRPDLRPVVVSGNPEVTSNEHAVFAVHWKDLHAVVREARQCEVIILGGGGIFEDYEACDLDEVLTPSYGGVTFYSTFPLLAWLLEKPLMIYGAGVGPLFNQPARDCTRLSFELARCATVRDNESRNLLTECGVNPDSTTVTADPALGLRPAEPAIVREKLRADGVPRRNRRFLAVSVRYWDREIEPEIWMPHVAAALDRMVREFEYTVLFLPFQEQAPRLENDLEVALQVRSMMRHSNKTHVTSSNYTPSEKAGVIAACHLVLGMRLHSIIFAALGHVPVVGLAYDPKVRHFMRRIGCDHLTLELPEAQSEILSRLLIEAHTDRSNLIGRIKPYVRSLKELAAKNDQELNRLLNAPLEQDQDLSSFATSLVKRLMLSKSLHLIALENVQIARRELVQSREWELATRIVRLRRRLFPEGGLRERLARRGLEASGNLFRDRHSHKGVTTPKPSTPRAMTHAASDSSAKTHMGAAQIQLADDHASRSRIPIIKRCARRLLPERLRPPVRKLHGFLWHTVHRGLVKRYEQALRDIVYQYRERKDIVLLAPSVEWDINLFQRPQQLALALAREGVLVFYVEPALSRRPAGLTLLRPGLYLAHLPLATFRVLENPAVLVQSWNVWALKALRECRIVYDYIDDLAVFPFSQRALRRNHKRLIERSSVVVATSERLHREVSVSRNDSLLCPNAADYEHFSKARLPNSLPVPTDMAPILAKGKPIVGYHGALARWFDYDLTGMVARKREELSIVLIGTDWDNTIGPSGLLKVGNVHWLGPKPYEELPSYVRWFTIAMIPFTLTDMTHAVSPIKLFEYMAAGKPVVATAIHEAKRYEGVMVGNDASDFLDKIDAALTMSSDPGYLALVDSVARENTWQARARQILTALE